MSEAHLPVLHQNGNMCQSFSEAQICYADILWNQASRLKIRSEQNRRRILSSESDLTIGAGHSVEETVEMI